MAFRRRTRGRRSFKRRRRGPSRKSLKKKLVRKRIGDRL